LYGDRNRHHYQELLKRIKPVYRKNVQIYEFNVKKTTLHKKVVVVDNTVFGGSSNLGYKSLETMSDHEMNFMAEGAQFAKAVIKILRTDRVQEVHAEKIMGSQKLSLGQKWAVLRHKLLAPLIG
jgi:phosphatidylserine/phosphatidylglycerophosphate/cardiolipin synthase-like enzyme